MLRGLAAVATIAFLAAAGVQWNDPDATGWMLTYGIAAGLAALAAMGQLPLLPNAGAFLMFSGLAVAHAPHLTDFSMEAISSFRMLEPSHESTREAAGLALCALWTGASALLAWRRRGDERA